MSRDINDVIKEVMKNNKEMHKVDDKLTKEIGSIHKEIDGLKKDIKIISIKVHEILDLLTTLSIFIEDAENIVDDIEQEEEYESNEGWLPEVNNWEDNYDPDEDDETI